MEKQMNNTYLSMWYYLSIVQFYKECLKISKFYFLHNVMWSFHLILLSIISPKNLLILHTVLISTKGFDCVLELHSLYTTYCVLYDK